MNIDESREQVRKRSSKADADSIRFEDFISPEFLRALSESSEGFTIRPDPGLSPHRTGYTNLETRTIYYNPLFLRRDPELGKPRWGREDVQGFAFHEVGHHVKEVLKYDHKLRDHLLKMEIPKAFNENAETTEKFIRAIRGNLQNGVIDIWLESYLSRRPHILVGDSISSFQSGKGDIESYTHMPLPEQFVQYVLRSRYFGDADYEKKLSPEVAHAYKEVKNRKALECLMDVAPYVRIFSNPAEQDQAILRKVAAYTEVFLPQYIKLIELEIEKRKTEHQPEKEELNQEEIEEIIKQLLEELQKLGEERSQMLAPSKEDEVGEEKINQRIIEIHAKDAEGLEGSNPPVESDLDGEASLRRTANEIFRRFMFDRQRGLAASNQVSEASVRLWQETKETRKNEINNLSSALAEVFLDDRRWKNQYMKREGEIVPGLEYETVSALLSGQPDPDTKFRQERAPEFLELEIEWIVDTSGSMSNKISESVALVVVVTEALKKVHQTLADESLLDGGEYPFRIGAIKYSTEPERVSKLRDPLNDEKELKMIDSLSKIGGGTSETETLKTVQNELKLSAPNVIKIVIMLTDGEGDREGVWPVMQSIERDNEIIFAVAALKTDDAGNAAINSYAEGLSKKRENTNVQVFAFDDLKKLIPSFVDFISKQVYSRKTGH